MVTLAGVSLRFEGSSRPALRDIDLEIEAGSTVALVGAMGSGKTALVSLLPRLYDPAEGSVSIDGAELRDVDITSLREQVGLVSDDPFLFSDTVRNNIAYARPDAPQEVIEDAARRADIHDFIAGLPDGYDTMVGSRGHRFSGGEKQRIAIARTLLRDPRVLVLDEATSALDTETERDVQQAFDALAKGRTTITIAHRLSTVRDADQIAVLDHGRIAETGTHTSLISGNGRYALLAA